MWPARVGRAKNQMSTEPAARHRAAVVLARYDASSAVPEGIAPDAFAAACLLDSYEVLADLIGVQSGIAGPLRSPSCCGLEPCSCQPTSPYAPSRVS